MERPTRHVTRLGGMQAERCPTTPDPALIQLVAAERMTFGRALHLDEGSAAVMTTFMSSRIRISA